MDVGNPNNFPRLLDLLRNRSNMLQKESGVTGEIIRISTSMAFE